MPDLLDNRKIGANVKKTGTIVLDNGKYYFEVEAAPGRKERVAFGPLVKQAELKNLVGKKGEAIMAFNGTDLKTSLAAVSIVGFKCYMILCYVVPVFKKYFDQLPADTILGFDMESKANFIDSMVTLKAFPVETATAMKVAINAHRQV
jgi:hypothetical protein